MPFPFNVRPLIPPRLRRGDLIGLISPASPVGDPHSIERAVAYLERNGYRALVGRFASADRGYLAGTDEERASDIHAMFSNAEVRALFCLRGGYGSPRLLSRLDYRLIGKNPKILVGFSDITALQLALWKKCRLVTFHGPMPLSDWEDGIDPFTEESFWRMIGDPPDRLPLEGSETEILRGGQSGGVLLGGNLSLIASIMGTPYQPDFSGCVLFLEEVDEEPYRVDRMLTQLGNAGILRRAAALLMGQFVRCTPRNPSGHSLNIREILADMHTPHGIPVLLNIPVGHVRRKLTLPVGVRVRVDAEKREIILAEPPIS